MFLELLYRLQELEMKENEIQQSIKKMPQFKELKLLKEKFSFHQKKLEEKKLFQEQVAKELKRFEDRIGVMETKQKELNKLLYAGSINNPKELESLEQQVKTLKDQISHVSDEIIKQMEEKEELDRELSQIERELQVQYQDFNKLKLQYNRVKINLEQELAGISEEKERIAPLIDEKWIIWYHEKKEQYAGTPVGRIMENQACSGCRTVIPIIIVKEARANPGSVYCEKCGRMLYAPSIC